MLERLPSQAAWRTQPYRAKGGAILKKILTVCLLALPMVLAAQTNLSGVWRWDRPASDTSPNNASQMWKKIEQDGDRITVRTRVVNKGAVESQVFVFVAGTSGNSNRMHGAPMTSSVRW